MKLLAPRSLLATALVVLFAWLAWLGLQTPTKSDLDIRGVEAPAADPGAAPGAPGAPDGVVQSGLPHDLSGDLRNAPAIEEIEEVYDQAFKYPYLLRWKGSARTSDFVANHLIAHVDDEGLQQRLKAYVEERPDWRYSIISSGVWLLSWKATGKDAFFAAREDLLRHFGDELLLELDFIRHLTRLPNDPQFKFQRHHAIIQSTEAWDHVTWARTVVVAVLDSGIDLDHPDLVSNLYRNPGEIAGNNTDDDGNGLIDDVQGWDFYDDDNQPDDTFGHGTHVAGIVGATGDNLEGGTGVCWRVRLFPVRFIRDMKGGTMSDYLKALDYIERSEVDILNASFAGFEYSKAEFDAIQRLQEKGVLVVAGAGNDSQDLNEYPLYPACVDLPNVLTVGAVSQAYVPASFSNYGEGIVDLYAPGVDIYSTIPDGLYSRASGTSMAAPMVSGAVALYLELNPGLGVTDLLDRLDEVGTTNLKKEIATLNLRHLLFAYEQLAPRVFAIEQLGEFRFGCPLKLRASFTSDFPVTLQWYKDGVPLDGETEEILSIQSATFPSQGTYSVSVRNHFGANTSPDTYLEIPERAPTIVSISPPITVQQGERLTIQVTAEGTPTLRYRWFRNGSSIGHFNPELRVANVSEADAGDYTVEVSNQVGSVESAPIPVSIIQKKYVPEYTPQERAFEGPLVGNVYIKRDQHGSLLISEDYLSWSRRFSPVGEIPLQFWIYEDVYFVLTQSGSIYSTADWRSWTAEASIGKPAPASVRSYAKGADILLRSGTGWVQWFNCVSGETADVPLGKDFQRLITVFNGLFYAGNASSLWSSADGIDWSLETDSRAAPLAIEPETGSLIGVRLDADMFFHLKNSDGSWRDLGIHYSPNYRLADGYLESEAERFNLSSLSREPPSADRIEYEDANIILYANGTIHWKQLGASFLLGAEGPPRGNQFSSLEASVVLAHDESVYLWEAGLVDPIELLRPPGLHTTSQSIFTLDNLYAVFLQDGPDGLQFALWRNGAWDSIVPSIKIDDYLVRQYGDLFVLVQYGVGEETLAGGSPNKYYSWNLRDWYPLPHDTPSVIAGTSGDILGLQEAVPGLPGTAFSVKRLHNGTWETIAGLEAAEPSTGILIGHYGEWFVSLNGRLSYSANGSDWHPIFAGQKLTLKKSGALLRAGHQVKYRDGSWTDDSDTNLVAESDEFWIQNLNSNPYEMPGPFRSLPKGSQVFPSREVRLYTDPRENTGIFEPMRVFVGCTDPDLILRMRIYVDGLLVDTFDAFEPVLEMQFPDMGIYSMAVEIEYLDTHVIRSRPIPLAPRLGIEAFQTDYIPGSQPSGPGVRYSIGQNSLYAVVGATGMAWKTNNGLQWEILKESVSPIATIHEVGSETWLIADNRPGQPVGAIKSGVDGVWTTIENPLGSQFIGYTLATDDSGILLYFTNGAFYRWTAEEGWRWLQEAAVSVPDYLKPVTLSYAEGRYILNSSFGSVRFSEDLQQWHYVDLPDDWIYHDKLLARTRKSRALSVGSVAADGKSVVNPIAFPIPLENLRGPVNGFFFGEYGGTLWVGSQATDLTPLPASTLEFDEFWEGGGNLVFFKRDGSYSVFPARDLSVSKAEISEVDGTLRLAIDIENLGLVPSKEDQLKVALWLTNPMGDILADLGSIFVETGSLTNGLHTTVNADVPFPADLPLDEYAILIELDPDDAFKEANEENNQLLSYRFGHNPNVIPRPQRSGSGSITSGRWNIGVRPDEMVDLTASADPGYAFLEWSGAVSSRDPDLRLSAKTAQQVTAHFVPQWIAECFPGIHWAGMDGRWYATSGDSWIHPTSVNWAYIPAVGWVFGHESHFPGCAFSPDLGWLWFLPDTRAAFQFSSGNWLIFER